MSSTSDHKIDKKQQMQRNMGTILATGTNGCNLTLGKDQST